MIWTISSLLTWSTEYFTKHHIDNPHLEAEILLSHALKLKRIELYIKHDKELNESELASYKTLILRRAKKEPSAYIIGNKAFMSLDFIVSPAVLIPRPETEHLVEAVIDYSKTVEYPINILDIGTGSGAIAISLANYIKNATVMAIDISNDSLLIAKQNAKKHEVESRITFLQSDLYSNIPSLNKFDVIVSNPPYIPSIEVEKLQEEIIKYEPIKALDGGDDGMALYSKIIPGSIAYLKSKGYLILEIGQGQFLSVNKIIVDTGLFNEAKIIKDYADIERIVIVQKK